MGTSRDTYISPKFQKYLKFLTARTGFCVVYIVVKLQYYVGNCLLFRFYLFGHWKHLIGTNLKYRGLNANFSTSPPKLRIFPLPKSRTKLSPSNVRIRQHINRRIRRCHHPFVKTHWSHMIQTNPVYTSPKSITLSNDFWWKWRRTYRSIGVDSEQLPNGNRQTTSSRSSNSRYGLKRSCSGPFMVTDSCYTSFPSAFLPSFTDWYVSVRSSARTFIHQHRRYNHCLHYRRPELGRRARSCTAR